MVHIQNVQVNKLILFILLGAVAGCSKDQPRKYVARKDARLYKEPIDGMQDVAHMVRKGETCYFEKEVAEKVYFFKEAVCKSGRGWTPDWMDFEEE